MSKNTGKDKGKAKNKPFVEMDDLERERAWDALRRDNSIQILEEARSCKDPIRIAVAELALANGKVVSSHYVPEYGDGEGSSQIDQFVRQVRRCKLLRKGETISMSVYTLDFQQLKK